MKKILFLLMFPLITTINSIGQLNVTSNDKLVSVGEHIYMKASQIKLSKDPSNGSYIIFYKDGEYNHIQDWKSFNINNEKSINELYELCSKIINEKSEEPITIELEDKMKLIVSYTKSWKGITFTIYSPSGIKSSTAPPMKQKNLNSLFGKT